MFFRPDPLFPLTACVEDDPMFVHMTWVGDTCVICIFLVECFPLLAALSSPAAQRLCAHALGRLLPLLRSVKYLSYATLFVRNHVFSSN